MRAPHGKARWLAAAALVVVIAGGGGTAWAMTRSSSTSTSALTTTLVAAATTDESQTVITTGTVEPAEQSDLAFTASGTITSVTATVGKKVTKGTVLATIDATTLTSAVTTATAAVTSAELSVTAAESETSTQLAAAKAALAEAENELTQAQAALSGASLTAPFTGVIASVDYAVGDTVGSSGPSTSTSSSSSTTGITLISQSTWIVNATVGSADLAELAKGQQATITPSGATASVFGNVSSVGVVATTSTSGSATFPVVIAVTGAPTGLYSGATADVTITVKKVTGVLTVPTAALHTVNGKTVVYKSVSGKQVTTEVTVGTSYGSTTQILAGIKAGEKVVSTGFGGPGGAGGGQRPRVAS